MKNLALRVDERAFLVAKPAGRIAPRTGPAGQGALRNPDKTIRFLIAPSHPNHYDQRMVEGLAAGLRALGHEARALPSPLGEIGAADVCRRLDVDVLIQINRLRPTYNALPAKVRHVAWLQDIFPASFDATRSQFHEGDIVYTLGDAGVLGLDAALPCHVGTLLTGVDETGLDRQGNAIKKRIDFSLCGYIPPPPEIQSSPRQDLTWYIQDSLKRLPLLGNSLPMALLCRLMFRRLMPRNHVPYAISSAMRNTAECHYRPLRGELDAGALASAMREMIAPVLVPQKQRRSAPPATSKRTRLGFVMAPYKSIAPGAQPEIDWHIDQYAREYPRLLDRRCLVQSVLTVSDSIELYGDGWQKHPEFRPYHKGFIGVQSKLYDVYRRTRLNLANNTHGLGLHSRTLECMAVGGFIFTHASPNDQKPGGIETSFEPGAHYGVYTPETFPDDARYWLSNESARIEAGAKAAEIVRQKHLWRHRAEQILADLKR